MTQLIDKDVYFKVICNGKNLNVEPQVKQIIVIPFNIMICTLQLCLGIVFKDMGYIYIILTEIYIKTIILSQISEMYIT